MNTLWWLRTSIRSVAAGVVMSVASAGAAYAQQATTILAGDDGVMPLTNDCKACHTQEIKDNYTRKHAWRIDDKVAAREFKDREEAGQCVLDNVSENLTRGFDHTLLDYGGEGWISETVNLHLKSWQTIPTPIIASPGPKAAEGLNFAMKDVFSKNPQWLSPVCRVISNRQIITSETLEQFRNIEREREFDTTLEKLRSLLWNHWVNMNQ